MVMQTAWRVQATLLLRDLSAIESLRPRLDPRIAALIPAHVTGIYEDEAPDSDLLVERLRVACREVPPIELRLGRVTAFDLLIRVCT